MDSTSTVSHASGSLELLKNNIKAVYDRLDKQKMWKLSTNTLVEEKMQQCAMGKEHEYSKNELRSFDFALFNVYYIENKLKLQLLNCLCDKILCLQPCVLP